MRCASAVSSALVGAVPAPSESEARRHGVRYTPHRGRACEGEGQCHQHYNKVRPHSSLGYKPPAPETILPNVDVPAYVQQWLRPEHQLKLCQTLSKAVDYLMVAGQFYEGFKRGAKMAFAAVTPNRDEREKFWSSRKVMIFLRLESPLWN